MVRKREKTTVPYLSLSTGACAVSVKRQLLLNLLGEFVYAVTAAEGVILSS